jgi:hypothetical protein
VSADWRPHLGASFVIGMYASLSSSAYCDYGGEYDQRIFGKGFHLVAPRRRFSQEPVAQADAITCLEVTLSNVLTSVLNQKKNAPQVISPPIQQLLILSDGQTSRLVARVAGNFDPFVIGAAHIILKKAFAQD